MAIELLGLHTLAIDERAAVADLLAGWHVEQWGELYDPEVWNLDIARSEFYDHGTTHPGSLPITIVALDSEVRQRSRSTPDGASGDWGVRGSVSLVASDDLAGYDHLGPWLASLYVLPIHRGQGLGSRLVDAVVAQAHELGVTHLYLFTAEHADWYRRWGFEAIGSMRTGPGSHQVTVMGAPMSRAI